MIKISRRDLISLHNTIKEFLPEKNTLYFTHAANRTLANIQPEIQELANLEQKTLPTEEEREYLQKEASLVREFGVKEKNYLEIDSERKDEFKVSFDKLQEENKELRETYIKKTSDFQEILNDEIEIDVVQCSLEHLPQELTNDQYNALKVLIKE